MTWRYQAMFVTNESLWLWMCGWISLASNILRRERKGLVTLQPSSCPHGRNLIRPIRSALFVDRIRCHEVQLRRNVFSECQHHYYLTAMFDNCVPRRQLGSCSVTIPFLSLWRVWLARLWVNRANVWMVGSVEFYGTGNLFYYLPKPYLNSTIDLHLT